MNQTRKVPAFFRKRVLKQRVNLCDKQQFCIKFGFFYISWSKIIQTSKNRSPLERYFQGLLFERNFVFLAQVLEEIHLFKVALCDQTLVRFSSLSFFHVYPLYLHRGSSKQPNIGNHWKDIFKGYHLSAISCSQIKYFRRYACFKLIQVTRFWSDRAVWRFLGSGPNRGQSPVERG